MNYVLTLSVPAGTLFGNDPDDDGSFDAFTDVMCGGYDHCTDACYDAHSSTGTGCFCDNPCPWDWSGSEDHFTIFLPASFTPDEVIDLFGSHGFHITVLAVQTVDEWEQAFAEEFPELADF